MVEWLDGWMFEWLNCWMVECLNGCMVEWLDGYMVVGGLFSWQISWLSDSFVGRKLGWQKWHSSLVNTDIPFKFKVQGKTVLRVWRGNSIQVIRRMYLKSFQEFKSISFGKVILLEKWFCWKSNSVGKVILLEKELCNKYLFFCPKKQCWHDHFSNTVCKHTSTKDKFKL